MTQTDTQQLIQQAIEHQRLGRLQEAERTYRQILQREPNNPDALNLLGIIAAQSGHHNDGIELMRRALALRPDEQRIYLNLATALRQVGRDEEAADVYRRALKVREDPAILTQLANIYWKHGKGNDAEDALVRAIQLDPMYIMALHGLGTIYMQLGFYDKAADMMKRALDVEPNLVEARREFAVAMFQLNRFKECEEHARRVVEARPGEIVALNHLGMALQRLGKRQEADQYFAKVLDTSPTTGEEWFNRGLALSSIHRIPEALESYRQALALSPSSIPARLNYGVMCAMMGNNAEAMEAYERVSKAAPDYGTPRMHHAVSLLLAGRMDEGWVEYKWRWQCPTLHDPPRPFTEPLWEKQGVAGKTVLLHGEQGYGDQIQFARYAMLVARRGAKVILEVRPPLVTLMRSLKGVKQVVARGDALPAFDLHAPLLDLPAIFGTIVRTVPADVPYLHADEEKVAEWAQRLAKDEPEGRPAMRVGIAWAGSPTHRQDRNRSVSLQQFATLVSATVDRRVGFISLQKGDAGKQAANPPSGMWLRDYTADLNDFSDTAALLMNLDLVISVDTSVVHLAGALARPVWTLITIGPDWRWLEDRDDSPWYPTMKLFRQTKFDHWDHVFARVAHALKREVEEKSPETEGHA